MRLLVYTIFITNNHELFHLWWKKNLLNHQKFSKYYKRCFSRAKSLQLWSIFWPNSSPRKRKILHKNIDTSCRKYGFRANKKHNSQVPENFQKFRKIRQKTYLAKIAPWGRAKSNMWTIVFFSNLSTFVLCISLVCQHVWFFVYLCQREFMYVFVSGCDCASEWDCWDVLLTMISMLKTTSSKC